MKKNVVVTAAALLMIAIAGAPAQAQTPAAGQTPAATQKTVPFATAGPRVDLSIEEAVARARDKNIDIGVARITPRLTDFTLAGLEANYRMNVTSTINNQRVNTIASNAGQGIAAGTTQLSQTENWNGGLAQNLYRGGGNYTLNWTNSRRAATSANNFRNPQFNSGLTFAITQPLMRGFRIDATRASLRTSRISQQNDEITLQSTTATTMANTRNAYWDLVFAIQAVEAAQSSLDISNKLVQDNQARVEIGTLAPIDIKSAEAESANRRLTLVQAQATVRTSELALKRLIVSGTDDPLWGSSINPVDRPAATPEPINVDAAVARALRERTDLQQSINNLKISDINLQSQVDATRPQLNVVANYGLTGLGGPFTPTAIDPITGQRINQAIVNSGYFDAIRNIVGFDVPAFTVGVSFAYPLGKSAQEATVARTKLSLEQSNANLKALQLQIATDVANAALTVQSSLESVQASKTARELSKDKLDAMQSKFDVGMSTNYEVVQAQRDFSDAQNNELRALLNYRKALVNFEAVQTVGTRARSARSPAAPAPAAADSNSEAVTDMKKLIWIVLLLIAVGATGAVFYAKRGDKEPTVTTLKTSRGSIIDAVGATGTLQAVTTVTVGTQVSGIVQSLENVDFNSIVKKGQIIARLDPSILETQVETAKANLTSAQANLVRQQVAVTDAESKLKRAKELADRQLINKVDLENAETTVKSAQAQLKSTESAIVQAEASVNKAKVDLDHTVITAPIDGIIIKRSVDRGQTVNAGMQAPELFIIAADLTKMQVNASIDESDVGRMRPGQDVTFRVDAYPLETFHGNVKQVRLNPVTVQNVVTYSTVIDVPNPELKLKPGMTANVSIEIARRDNVLRVPNAALRFRPTKDIFDALNQAMPPELERGGKGGPRGGGANGANGPGGPAGTGQAASPAGAPSAPSQPGVAAGGKAGTKAPSAEQPAQAGDQSKAGRTGGRNRQQGDQASGGNAGGGRNAGGGNPSAGPGQGGGQGGRGGFSNMTPEERQKAMEARLAAMTPEERAAFEERRKQRQAQGGGPGGGGNFGGRGGGQGGNAGNFQRSGGQGGNTGGRGGQSGNAANFQRSGGGQGGGSTRGPQQSQASDNPKSAANTTATTIDALFAPLPSVETRGRAWLYINKQLKPVSLRLGITDSTYTEVLNDTELQPDVEVVTSIITPEMASKPANQNNANGNPLMPQRGRGGPGGPGGAGGGGRGGGR